MVGGGDCCVDVRGDRIVVRQTDHHVSGVEQLWDAIDLFEQVAREREVLVGL